MIRYRFSGNKRHPEPIAFIGLSSENLIRLRAGRPVRIDLGDPLGLGVELVIYHGASDVELTRELERKGFMPPGSTAKTEAAFAQHEARTSEAGGPSPDL